MPTPVGHALTGALLFGVLARPEERRPPPLAVAGFAAVVADLDFLPGLLVGNPSRFHQGPAHSLGAALVFGVLAGWCVRYAGLGPPGRWIALFTLLYASHPLLDLFAVDTSPPIGVPLLWPFSGLYVHAPVILFPDVHHGPSWAAFVNWHNLRAVIPETLGFGTLTAAVFWWRLGRRPTPATACSAPGPDCAG